MKNSAIKRKTTKTLDLLGRSVYYTNPQPLWASQNCSKGAKWKK